MNHTARLRSINATDEARTVPEPAGRSRPRGPLHRGDAATPDRRRAGLGLDRWSPALTFGLALASPRSALLVTQLLGPLERRGPDA